MDRLVARRKVAHRDRTLLAVQSAKDRSATGVVRFAHGVDAQEDRDTRGEHHVDLFTRLESVEEGPGGHHREVTERVDRVLKLLRWTGKEESVERGADVVGPSRAPLRRSPKASSRESLGARPASAFVRKGSGQPPGGVPSSPSRNPMTLSGMS